MHSAGSSPKKVSPEKKSVEPSADSSKAPMTAEVPESGKPKEKGSGSPRPSEQAPLTRQPSGILSQAELDEISAAELASSGQQKGQ